MTTLQDLGHVRKLDLGSGARPKPGFVGLDVREQKVEPPAEVWQFDLASGDPWPIEDGQVTELYSSHLIEHLPPGTVRAHEFVKDDGVHTYLPGLQRFVREQDALFWFMDECYRVAAPGALFELRWPALVNLRGATPVLVTTAFMDPTHRRFIPIDTLAYFDPVQREGLSLTGYEVSCAWRTVKLFQGELGHGHLENIAILKKVER